MVKSLQAAEGAVLWARRPSATPGLNNFQALLQSTDKELFVTDPHGWWPTISRLLIMARPELLETYRPHFIEALDGQAGVSKLCIWYRELTGEKPKVRSWRHVNQ